MKSWLKKKLSSVVAASDDGSDEIDRSIGFKKGKKEKGLATPQKLSLIHISEPTRP